MSFAFAGTPRFASLVLRELVELGRVPALVISQPDRPRGRGRSGKLPHAVEEAQCHGLDCLQTEDINAPEVAERLRAAGIDTLIVAAFGQLLKRPLLDSFACLNIHASLLPRYRGAAPVERALMDGVAATGVTIMRITEELDAGPWAEMVEVSVGLADDAGEVYRVLAVTGAVAMANVLTAIEDGRVVWTEQTGQTTYAHKLGPEDSWLHVDQGARRAHDQIRALSPGIGVRALLGESEVKIWRSWPYGEPGLQDVPAVARGAAGRTGEVLVGEGRLFVGCAAGCIEVMEIQPACRARMSAGAYLRGYTGSVCSPLGVAGADSRVAGKG